MPGQVLRHDLCVCLHVGGVGASEAPPTCPLSMAKKRQGLETVPWNQVSGSWPCPSHFPSPASKLRGPHPAPRWVLPSCLRAARRPRGLQTAGDAAPHGPAHIWFSFECPNVITFSATQRKSLVRCGFPHFPSRLRNQSLSFHQPPCHPSVLFGKGHGRTLLCFLELMAGAQGRRSPTVPLTHLRGLTAEATTAGSPRSKFLHWRQRLHGLPLVTPQCPPPTAWTEAPSTPRQDALLSFLTTGSTWF